jgi:hypothetical protein
MQKAPPPQKAQEQTGKRGKAVATPLKKATKLLPVKPL